MSWSQQYPGLGMTPMNRSRLGLGAMGDPTEQYANDPYPSMQSSMMPTNPFSPFSMSSMLPLNKFSGSGMGGMGGMMNPWVQNPWDNYQPTQWAGPNAHYPNWNDPWGPFANDVAVMGPYPVPTDPDPVEVVEVLDSSNRQSPNWEGPDPERVQAMIDHTRRNSLNFYRNNPDHPLSKFDAAIRNTFGVRQLDSPGQLAGKPQTVPQGYTPQPEPAPQTQPQYQTDPGLAGGAAYRHGSFPVLGPQRTGMQHQYMGALKPRTATTTTPTWQESHAFEEAAKKRGAAQKASRAAAARTAKQKAGVARRSAEGAGRDTAGERSAGMGGGRGGFAGPDRW